MSLHGKFRLTFALSALLLGSSCATLKGLDDRVKVASRPPGAEVIVNGKPAGITPEFVSVRRQTAAHIQLLSKKQVHDLELKGEYRWRESFVPNFVFLFLAPIGWGVDLLTGAAWEYPRLEIVDFAADKNPPQAESRQNESRRNGLQPSTTVIVRRIAIAPPQASRELLSDELGSWMEKSARARYVNDQVIDFDRSYSTFRDFEYGSDDRAAPFLMDQLADALSATHFLESNVISVTSAEVVLNVTLRNAYTDEIEEEYRLSVQGDAIDFNRKGAFAKGILSLVSILPNHTSLDTATPRSNFAVDGPSAGQARYSSQSDKSPNFFSYLTSIGLGSVRSPRPVSRTSAHFRFIPHLALTYDRFAMNSSTSVNELQGITYSWYNLILGLGPEGSIETTIGTFYLQLLPCIGYNWVYWNQGVQDKASYQTDFQLEAEFGWRLFLTNRFTFKIFSHTISASSSQWADVFNQSLGRNSTVYTQQQVSGGFSIGYYFPEGREALKSIFR